MKQLDFKEMEETQRGPAVALTHDSSWFQSRNHQKSKQSGLPRHLTTFDGLTHICRPSALAYLMTRGER